MLIAFVPAASAKAGKRKERSQKLGKENQKFLNLKITGIKKTTGMWQHAVQEQLLSPGGRSNLQDGFGTTNPEIS